MNLNPAARLADNALEHSRAISIARRAIRRARAFKHRKFWYKWEDCMWQPETENKEMVHVIPAKV